MSNRWSSTAEKRKNCWPEVTAKDYGKSVEGPMLFVIRFTKDFLIGEMCIMSLSINYKKKKKENLKNKFTPLSWSLLW